MHAGEKPFNCEFCDKHFLTNSNLKQHKIIHLDIRNKFTCKQCDKLYYYHSSLKKHLKAHEKEAQKKLQEANENKGEIIKLPEVDVPMTSSQHVKAIINQSQCQIPIVATSPNEERAKENISQAINTDDLINDLKMNCFMNNYNIQQFNFIKNQQQYMPNNINDLPSLSKENGILYYN